MTKGQSNPSFLFCVQDKLTGMQTNLPTWQEDGYVPPASTIFYLLIFTYFVELQEVYDFTPPLE